MLDQLLQMLAKRGGQVPPMEGPTQAGGVLGQPQMNQAQPQGGLLGALKAMGGGPGMLGQQQGQVAGNPSQQALAQLMQQQAPQGGGQMFNPQQWMQMMRQRGGM
jgi:hypothetical protein